MLTCVVRTTTTVYWGGITTRSGQNVFNSSYKSLEHLRTTTTDYLLGGITTRSGQMSFLTLHTNLSTY